MNDLQKYFYQSQIDWIKDDSPLKLAVKSRQIGFSFANSCRLVLQVSADDARLDGYISSRHSALAAAEASERRRKSDEGGPSLRSAPGEGGSPPLSETSSEPIINRAATVRKRRPAGSLNRRLIALPPTLRYHCCHRVI